MVRMQLARSEVNPSLVEMCKMDVGNLWAHTREIYKQSGVKETCNAEEIKILNYSRYKETYPKGFIALESDMSLIIVFVITWCCRFKYS